MSSVKIKYRNLQHEIENKIEEASEYLSIITWRDFEKIRVEDVNNTEKSINEIKILLTEIGLLIHHESKKIPT